jgi:hypothetical protein
VAVLSRRLSPEFEKTHFRKIEPRQNIGVPEARSPVFAESGAFFADLDRRNSGFTGAVSLMRIAGAQRATASTEN